MATAMSKPTPPILTLREAAFYLRISERTLWALARKGGVPSFKLGNQHRFNLAELQELGRRQG